MQFEEEAENNVATMNVKEIRGIDKIEIGEVLWNWNGRTKQTWVQERIRQRREVPNFECFSSKSLFVFVFFLFFFLRGEPNRRGFKRE